MAELDDPTVIHRFASATQPTVGGKLTITTACGITDRPYGFDRTGLRSSSWPNDVTCPECKAAQ